MGLETEKGWGLVCTGLASAVVEWQGGSACSVQEGSRGVTEALRPESGEAPRQEHVHVVREGGEGEGPRRWDRRPPSRSWPPAERVCPQIVRGVHAPHSERNLLRNPWITICSTGK